MTVLELVTVKECDHSTAIGTDNGNGTHTVSCPACGKDEKEAAEAHKGGTATCQKKAVCEICGAEYGDLGEHSIINVPAKDATCAAEGNIQHWKCSVCDKRFSDEEGKNEITPDSTVIAKGSHDLTGYAYSSASCNYSGNRAYWYCGNCGKYFSDSSGTTETTWSAIRIPARGHYYDNGKCSRCGRFEDGIGRLSGASLSLSGNIGVNFFMELDSSTIRDENAYMQFTLPNGDTPKIPVSDAQQKNGYYVFSCEVSAKEMDGKITAQIITSDSEGTEYEYSVKEYADSIENQSADQKTLALVKAMANYGDYAKAYFGGESIAATEEMNAVTADILTKYEKQEQGELPKGITYYGSSLILESNTTLRHYFKVAEGADVSQCNFSGKKGKYYYIDIANIAAGNLFDTNTTTVGSYTIEYSPMTYVLAVLNNDSADETLKNTVKALYLYAKAADSYAN